MWRSQSTATADGAYAAARLVRSVIDQVAARCDVLRPQVAEQDIAIALRRQLPIRDDDVEVIGVRVHVTVDEVTRKAALRAQDLRHDFVRKAELVRQEAELDELARRQARAREEFLRTEILATPASARLYSLIEKSSVEWHRLAGPPAGVDPVSLVEEIQRWQPDQQWVTVARLLHDFVAELSEQGRRELLLILAEAIRVYGNDTVAQTLADLADKPPSSGT
ncbi:hypothetical protein ACPA54_03430 [Uniformispora flossi]|uniref:hypothetical protein n=1 Tax=Uniformispora flossi TaxID=3390723 RepID=UPI003C2BCE68